MIRKSLGLTLVLVAGRLSLPSAMAAGEVFVLHAANVHVGNGEVIANGTVIVRNGRIEAVGAGLTAPSGSQSIEVPLGSITPGLIDANAAIESSDLLAPFEHPRTPREVIHDLFCPRHAHNPVPGCCGSSCPRSSQHATGDICKVCGFPNADVNMAVGTRDNAMQVENASEVICDTRVLDTVDLESPDFGRLARGGVTTVFVAPDSAAVIGSRGAVVRTGGKQRVLREAGAIKASLGTEPSWRGMSNRLPWRKEISFYARRPRTRMGVAWVFRKACNDARRLMQGLALSGADTASASALREWHKVLDGSSRLRFQARQQHDILTACRLADEFNLSFVIEEATQAHLCLDELKARSVPVVYGPIYVTPTGDRAMSTEVGDARLHTMKTLIDAGIETALTAHELRDEDGLARQAMYALRYGVDPAAVDRSVFESPAKLLGLDDQLGTLVAGKRADLVVWSGAAFAASSQPEIVLIDGEVVFDDRRTQ